MLNVEQFFAGVNVQTGEEVAVKLVIIYHIYQQQLISLYKKNVFFVIILVT